MNKLTIDVLKAIVLTRLILKFVNSYDIPVDIVNIPSKGINNKNVNNIKKNKKKLISLGIIHKCIMFINIAYNYAIVNSNLYIYFNFYSFIN